MDDLIATKLNPSSICGICKEHFTDKHVPVALPCYHILGHGCISDWLKSGHKASNTCPICRRTVFALVKDPTPPFDDNSIWRAICDQPAYQIHGFVSKVWEGISKMCRDDCRRRQYPNSSTRSSTVSPSDGVTFKVDQYLQEAIFPALQHMGRRNGGTRLFLDCHNLTRASWNSLGRPNHTQGIATPLVRLARLMSQTSGVTPQWMASVVRISLLFWNANACINNDNQDIQRVDWNYINEAAQLVSPQYFPLLHLYTFLISQTIAHGDDSSKPWPKLPHEVTNLVLHRCWKTFGRGWKGKPSTEFKNRLVIVYEEMRRLQKTEKKNPSLRNHEGEEHIVRGLWAMASWTRGKVDETVMRKRA